VDRYFVVVAHTTASSAKVKCEVCGASKTFKLPKAQARKKPPGSSKAKSAKAPKPADSLALYNELRDKIGLDKVQPYNMRSKFGLAVAIQHPKFGVGFVTAATPEKIEVAFQEGGRALVHNRAN
jgi:hypothetical protein